MKEKFNEVYNDERVYRAIYDFNDNKSEKIVEFILAILTLIVVFICGYLMACLIINK